MFARYKITPASPWASLLSQDNGDFVWTADLSVAASARIVLVMIPLWSWQVPTRRVAVTGRGSSLP
jgi:hypothetical protein